MSGLTSNNSYVKKGEYMKITPYVYTMLSLSYTWDKKSAQLFLKLTETEISAIWKEAMKPENNCKAEFSERLVYREKFLEFIKTYKKKETKKENSYEM